MAKQMDKEKIQLPLTVSAILITICETLEASSNGLSYIRLMQIRRSIQMRRKLTYFFSSNELTKSEWKKREENKQTNYAFYVMSTNICALLFLISSRRRENWYNHNLPKHTQKEIHKITFIWENKLFGGSGWIGVKNEFYTRCMYRIRWIPEILACDCKRKSKSRPDVAREILFEPFQRNKK